MFTPVALRRATSDNNASNSSSSAHRRTLDASGFAAHANKARYTPLHGPSASAANSSSSSYYAVLHVRPGGNNIHASNTKALVTHSSEPQRASPLGIAIGTLSSAAFHCNNDPMVSPEHGTLERTARHGVWVYVDHSAHGTRLNSSRRVHREAVVVHTGDRLLVGNTEIELCLDAPGTQCSSDAAELSSKSDAPPPPPPQRQLTSARLSSSNSNNQSSSIAPSPIDVSAHRSPSSGSNSRVNTGTPGRSVEPLPIERPTIATSGASFATATPPEYIASPVPAAYARRKRHSMTAFTPTPSPPPSTSTGSSGGASPYVFHQRVARPVVPSPPPRSDAMRRSTAAVPLSPHLEQQSPPHRQHMSNQREDTSSDSSESAKRVEPQSTARIRPARRPSVVTAMTGAAPPPLAYSSSPLAAPASRMQQPPAPTPLELSPSPSPPLTPLQHTQQRHQRLHAADAPKSQRDNLRVQLLLKNLQPPAAATRTGSSSSSRAKPSGLEIPSPPSSVPSAARPSPSPSSSESQSRSHLSNQLEFTPPSSPVAHRDLVRQKESLLTILQHKYKEEQLLKAQQEEWLRRHFTRDATATTVAAPAPAPAPATDPAPALSSSDTGDADSDVSDSAIPPRAPALLRTISLGLHHASPRLTAAVLASRARTNSGDSSRRSNQQRSPKSRQRDTRLRTSQDSVDVASVSSSASTELACYRRITRSLSIASSDDDLSVTDEHDFVGYEDDDAFHPPGYYDDAFLPPGYYDDAQTTPTDDRTDGTTNDSSAPTRRRGSLLFSAYYTAPSSGASSLSSGTTSTSDRFSIDLAPSQAHEPEDDDVLESPTSATAAGDDDATSATTTSNLFATPQRSPFKTMRFTPMRNTASNNSDDMVVSDDKRRAASSGRHLRMSPSTTRRSQRLPSPL